MSYKNLKKQAKQIYKSDFGRNAGIGFVAFIIKLALFLIVATFQFICVQAYGSSFMHGLASIPFLLIYVIEFIFVVLPVNTGLGTYFAKISAGEKCFTDNIFAHFSRFKTDVAAQIMVSIIIFAEILIWDALCTLLPSSAIVSILLFAAALAAVIYTLLIFSAVTYVIANYNNLSAAEICTKSIKITKGNRIRLFGLICSFGGYILLSVLTLGIGFIWLVPYINITTKLFIKNIERGF